MWALWITVLQKIDVFSNERDSFFFVIPETMSLLKPNNLYQNNLDTTHAVVGQKGCVDVTKWVRVWNFLLTHHPFENYLTPAKEYYLCVYVTTGQTVWQISCLCLRFAYYFEFSPRQPSCAITLCDQGPSYPVRFVCSIVSTSAENSWTQNQIRVNSTHGSV